MFVDKPRYPDVWEVYPVSGGGRRDMVTELLFTLPPMVTLIDRVAGVADRLATGKNVDKTEAVHVLFGFVELVVRQLMVRRFVVGARLKTPGVHTCLPCASLTTNEILRAASSL